MKNLLEVRNINKTFKKQKANDNISISVKENSIYGLLGPNGAGKSTLLKIITGMITPDSGKIIFDGRRFKRQDLAYIGALIEEAPIYDNLTARENLKVRTLLYGLPDSRIDEVLEIVDLKDAKKKKTGHFSMGMKQRLGIAIALLNNPKLLILDEPTNGLDPVGINKMRSLISSFPKRGITVILSSHILSEVEQIVDDIGIIVCGKILYEGKFDYSQNLERLFMNVVEEGGYDD